MGIRQDIRKKTEGRKLRKDKEAGRESGRTKEKKREVKI